METLHLVIYDRWGAKVYETNDPVFSWDGKKNGQLFNSQVFTYYLQVQFIDERLFEKKGNISLMR